MMLWLITLLGLLFPVAGGASDSLRWASSGGGWRALAAGFGYASLFAKAGLLDENGCKFSAISGNSGGTWFMSQLFYSPQIFEMVIDAAGNSTAIGEAVLDWMTAYLLLQEEAAQPLGTSPQCEIFEGIQSFDSFFPQLQDSAAFCEVLATFDWDWARFIEGMLEETAAVFGDEGFAQRIVSPENRVEPLQNTELYIQFTFVPNYRLRKVADADGEFEDIMTFLSPASSGGEPSYFTIPLAAHYAVKHNSTVFRYAAADTESPLRVGTAPTPESFDWRDYGEFSLFVPDSNGIIPNGTATSVLEGEKITLTDIMLRPPFGGKPASIAKVASASSAAAGQVSGSCPSSFAQVLSSITEGLNRSPDLNFATRPLLRRLLRALDNRVFSEKAFDRAGVCSQWPSNCTVGDLYFMDGGLSDGLTVTSNIGQYQSDGNLSVPMKLIVTDNNGVGEFPTRFLSYFATDFNRGIVPGDWIWAPASIGNSGQTTPWRSPQLFEEPLTKDSLLNVTQPIEGTNLTTALLNATTINNPAYGIRAGQLVEILFVQTNSRADVIILGPNATEASTPDLVELAEIIAGSNELLRRIKAFVGED